MKIKKVLFLLPLFLALGRLAAAQDASPGYTSGKWYVGVTYMSPPAGFSMDEYYYPGLMIGYRWHPRLSLQTGIGVVHDPREPAFPFSFSPQIPNQNPVTVRVPAYTSGGYVPLYLRYMISKPHRRFQAYGLAGFQAAFIRGEYYTASYQDGRMVGQQEFKEENNFTFSPGIGLGLRARVVHRFFLGMEMNTHLHQVFDKYRYRQGQLGFTLQYEFR